MNLLVVIGTLGAGIGLAAGLAFNLRLARGLGIPLAASLVNFLVGASVLFMLWLLGLDGTRPTQFPPVWTLIGGLLGSTYVTLSLVGAARLGVGVSTVAVTFGQVVSALLITGLGWFGQSPQAPTWQGVLSAVLLLTAVAVLASDRERHKP
jgi:bacterial/archaeal transporter family-2 protein